MKTSTGSSRTSTSQAQQKRSPKKKQGSSSSNNRLTPSEIESLRKESKELTKIARGRFKDLF